MAAFSSLTFAYPDQKAETDHCNMDDRQMTLCSLVLCTTAENIPDAAYDREGFILSLRTK